MSVVDSLVLWAVAYAKNVENQRAMFVLAWASLGTLAK